MGLRDYLWLALAATLAFGAWRLHADGYASGVAAQVAKDSAAQLKASEQARAKEHAQAEQFQAIAQQYDQDKADAQAKADRTIADLRRGNLRLQERWACPGVPGITTVASKRDGSAADRNESASRIIRAAAEADDQIRRLQEILRAERQ